MASEANLAKTVGILQNAVVNIEQSFASSAKTLTSNLAQSVEMMRSMNAMMEQFLQLAVHLETEVLGISEHDSEGPRLSVTVRNMSPFPISHATLNLRIRSQETSKTLSFQACFVDDANSWKLSDPDSDDRINWPLDTLQPRGAKNRDLHLRLRLPFFAQYNAEITLAFPSPATNTPLIVTHVAGLYLVDQSIRSFEPTQTTPTAFDDSTSVQLDMQSFRRVFNVRPSDGINVGATATLTEPNGEVVAMLKVIEISDNGTVLTACFESNNFASAVLQELCILCSTNK